MSKINNGGAAFPSQACGTDGLPMFEAEYGMTLRDWFAGQALRAIIEADGIQYASSVTAHAVFAYEQADAMLKAREANDAAS